MIVFDLHCAAGHVHEAWFGSRADYDDQKARGLVRCPTCDDPDVERAPPAPRLAGTGDRSAPDPRQMMRALATAQAELLKRSEHVGRRFASEARAIHAGDAADRPIHGRATLAEARALVDDGIPVAPLPLPVRDQSRDN